MRTLCVIMHKLNIKTTQLAFETLYTVLTDIFSVIVGYFNSLLFRPGIAPFRHYLQAFNPPPPRPPPTLTDKRTQLRSLKQVPCG